MTSATDELRRLLDERGVEWWAEDDPEDPPYYLVTKWFSNANEQTFEEIPAIRSRSLKAFCITPAQAIDATLGRGTCHAVFEVDAMSEDDRIGEFVCSECGETFGDGRDQLPHYCPACGKQVVE